MATAEVQLSTAAIRLATMARSAGVPRDTLERFLAAGYVPQPKQLLFHAAARECDLPDGPTRVGFGGARGPGKSHACVSQIVIDDCQRAENLKCLYLRKVGKAARESFEDLRRSALMGVAHSYTGQRGILEVPETGSRVILGHYRNESDIDSYLGLEYDVIALEEATQLSARKQRDIATCNRTSKSYWRPRMYYTTNPGGLGHAQFKEQFIKPWREQKESETRFIFATHKDNLFLNPEYIRNLDALVGWQRAAWRDGDWDIAAGQFFSTWNYDQVVKHGLKVIPDSPVWCALDYGFTHPTTVYLLSKYDGKLRVLDEYWRQKALVSQNAEGVKEMLARHNLKVEDLRNFVAGRDVFAKKGGETGKSIADEYAEHGIYLNPAKTDRIAGAGCVLSLLGNPDEGIEPGIEIDARCARLIECIPSLQHDPHRPEDVLKVDVDEDGQGGDDPYDGLRYGVMEEEGVQFF